MAIAGCSASATPPAAPVAAVKDPLAWDLYIASSETDIELLTLERTLTDAMTNRDVLAIEKVIQRADVLKRNWHKTAAPATGKTAAAAQKYEESLTLHTQMFEEGSRVARFSSLESSRAVPRLQMQAWDLAQAAQDELMALK